MQELTSAPQMASPYTPAGGSNMPALTAQQPKLGTPIPGTTGGLAAKPGLTVFDNPLSQSLQSNPQAQQAAQQTQSYGRGEDSVLVHMTPNEVNSLRGLAMQFGGDLTVNPNTGLPEAGWLGKLLPTILGAAGMLIPGAQPWMIAAAVGAGKTALTGDLNKGLMAGLGAFGGASLAGSFGAQSVFGEAAKAAAPEVAASGALPEVAKGATFSEAFAPIAQQGVNTAATVAPGAVDIAALNAPKGIAGALANFSEHAGAGLGGGMLGKAAPMAAGMGLLGTVSDLTAPKMPKYKGDKTGSSWNYEGPYVPGERQVSFQNPEQMRESGGAEYSYFTPSNPVPGYRPVSSLTEEEQSAYGFADGGIAALPKPEGFDDLISYFGSTSPGAITASMYPTTRSTPATSTATPATPAATASREQTYSFRNTPSATTTTPAGGSTSPTTGGFGSITIPGYGTFQLPDFSTYGNGAIDLDAIAALGGYSRPSQTQTQPATSVQDQLANVGYPDTSSLPSPLTRNPLVAEALAANPTDSVAPAPAPAAPVAPAPTFDFSQVPGFNLPQTTQPQVPAPTPAPAPVVPEMRDSLVNEARTADFMDSTITPAPGFDLARLRELAAASTPASTPVAPAPAPMPAPVAPAPAPAPAPTPIPSFDFSQIMQPQAPAPSFDFSQLLQPQAPVPAPAPELSFPQLLQPAPIAPVVEEPTRLTEMANPLTVNPTPARSDVDRRRVSRAAAGGRIDMRDGSFVVDARTVSELGNGSSNAGMELLARMGGRPVRGPGDGVSDSVPASIGGTQEARVARDEVIFSPEAVRRVGGGSEKRGTQKLYALMERAHKARKKAGRGSDTKLRKGLA